MIQRFTSLPLVLKILISAGALGAVFILVLGLPTMVTETSARFSSFLKGESQQGYTPGQNSMGEEEYLGMVEDVQSKSVESFMESDERFSRFDTLTSDDVEVMKTDSDTLKGYLDQVDDLGPPEKYKDQYGLFRSGISDLYQATELAYSLAANPRSVTKSGLNEYDLFVERAASELQQSNEILGRDYKTVTPRKSG